MNIVMTADAVGGVWTYGLDLAQGIAAAGHQVTLAVPGPAPSTAQRRQVAACAGLDLVTLDAPLDWTATDANELGRTAVAVADLVAQRNADLVHLNTPTLAALVDFAVPVVGVCHSCVATWWEAVHGGPLPQDFAWRSTLVAAGYRAADALVAPSRTFATATARVHGVPLPRVVHNGRKPPPRPDVPRAPLVLTAGRLWDAGKDVATLDRAAGRLGLNVPVLALGPLAGPDGVPIRFEHLRPLGSLDAADVAAQMARCAIFVSTALYEPFGLAVLEAAAAGMALVLSDIPTFRELWDGAALFVPRRKPEAFAAAIDSLLADSVGLEALTAAAGRRAAHYSVERMTDTYLDLYRRLVSPAFSRRRDGVAEVQP